MGNFYEKNRNAVIAFIVVVVLCLSGAWLVCDHYRNEPIYNNTDSTMADIEARIDTLESRIGTMQKRLDDTQKTISGIAVGITRSTGYAIEINEGLGRAEERLESAIQRSERIKNLITEIENRNQP